MYNVLELNLTHIGRFLEVPITAVVYEGILSMTIVHLTGLCSNLIEFGPCMFSSFAMEMSSIGSVRGRVAVCTVIFVVLHMDEWGQDSE
jgi:hypothetical protein